MPAPEKEATARSSVRAIVTSSSWLLASAVFAAATQWLIVSLVARSRGAAGLGEISLAQAYVTCVSYVGWLALRNHYVVEASNFRYSDYLFLRVAFPVLLFVLLTLGSLA